MKPAAFLSFDALILKKRMLIETVIEQLKNQSQLEHTLHQGFGNFQVNAVCALIAYTLQAKKLSLNLRVFNEIKDTSVLANF